MYNFSYICARSSIHSPIEYLYYCVKNKKNPEVKLSKTSKVNICILKIPSPNSVFICCKVVWTQNEFLGKWKKVKLFSCVWFFATPWTVAYHTPPSIGFSRQEYWSGLSSPSPEDLPNPGVQGIPHCSQMLHHLRHQGSLSLGREVCAYLCVFLCVCLVAQSCLTLGDPVDCSPPGSSVHEIFQGKNTGVGCHSLLQGIFPTQVSCIAGRFFTV